MNHLAAVAYASKATYPLRAHDLDNLLMGARAFNESVAVTGVLLEHRGVFFQYFEGRPADVATVYQRIKRSSMHEQLVERLNEPVPARQFERWHMAFTEAPLTTLQELANEIWAITLPRLHDSPVSSPGLTLLLKFWASAQRGDASN